MVILKYILRWYKSGGNILKKFMLIRISLKKFIVNGHMLKWTALCLACLAVTGCRAPYENEQTVSGAGEEKQDMSGDDKGEMLEFDIRNPIVFASYTFDEGDSYYTLLFECINGTYDSSNSLWNRQWSGTFRFRLIQSELGVNLEPYQEGVVSCELQQAFAGPFQLYVKDYNGDGLMEFAITQTESASAGDTGRMFALQKDGTVTEIPIKNDRRYVSGFGLIGIHDRETGVFLIPYRHTEGSADLEQIEHGFLVRTEEPFSRGSDSGIYFMGETDGDIRNAAALEDVYLWDGTSFMLTEQRLIYD